MSDYLATVDLSKAQRPVADRIAEAAPDARAGDVRAAAALLQEQIEKIGADVAETVVATARRLAQAEGESLTDDEVDFLAGGAYLAIPAVLIAVNKYGLDIAAFTEQNVTEGMK